MDCLNLIKYRRTTRKFTEESIDTDILKAIVKAGQYAPTANNKQDFQITVISSDKIISKLHEKLKVALDNPSYNKFYGASTLILISFPKENENAKYDTGCVLQNMMLQASSLNIGSVWINQFKLDKTNDIIRDVLNDLNIPKNHFVKGALGLGHTDENIHFNREIKSKVNFL